MPRGMSIHQGTGPQFTHVNYNNQQWTYIDIVSTSNWQHWCSSRHTAAHRRISQSQTRASQRLRPVAVSARLAPSHASYRGPERVCMGDRSFDVAGPRLWNKLLASLRSSDSLCQFRRQLKRFCLSRTTLRRLVTLAFRRRI